MPGPSFRPILGGLSMMVIMFGLVFGLPLLAAGVVMLVTTLLGWLHDARTEYGLVVEADQTGHPRNAPAPGYPTNTLTFFGVLVIAALLVNYGIIPPADANAGAAPASSGPTASGAAGAPGGAVPSGPAADVTIVAQNIQYTTTTATRAGRQAVHDRLRQRGRRHAPQRLDPHGRGRRPAGLPGQDRDRADRRDL